MLSGYFMIPAEAGSNSWANVHVGLIMVFLSLLVKTRNVDVTITNILEERVRYDPIPTFHELTAASSNSNRGGGSTVVSRKTNFSSVQRQLSLEERKRNLLEQARRWEVIPAVEHRCGGSSLTLYQFFRAYGRP